MARYIADVIICSLALCSKAVNNCTVDDNCRYCRDGAIVVEDSQNPSKLVYGGGHCLLNSNDVCVDIYTHMPCSGDASTCPSDALSNVMPEYLQPAWYQNCGDKKRNYVMGPAGCRGGVDNIGTCTPQYGITTTKTTTTEATTTAVATTTQNTTTTSNATTKEATAAESTVTQNTTTTSNLTTSTQATIISGPSSGLRFYASMDELTDGNQLKDLSGNNFHGTITMIDGSVPSSSLLQIGGPGGGTYIDFAGIHHIQLPSDDRLILPGNAARSVCYWQSHGENSQYLFSFGKQCPPDGSTFSARQNFGFMGCAMDASAVSSPDLFDGSWHHVCYTFDGSTVKMYGDGQIQNTFGATLDVTAASAGGIAAIGFHVWMHTHDWSSFSGRIDEFYIYDRELTLDEVNDLYTI